LQAAFFDLDGTLFTGHIWQGLAEHHRTHRTHRLHVATYMVTHMGLWLLHRAGLILEEPALAAWVHHLGWLMAGFSTEEAQEVFGTLVDEYVLPRLRDDVLQILRLHQSEGRPALLVSGTYQGLLDVIVQRLGLHGAAGTQLQVRQGRFSGGVIEPSCFSTGKVKRVQQILAHHPGIDLACSYAYGDTIYDLPLLESVAHPVVVYPDDRLARIARERGWPFVGDERNRT